MARPLTLGGGAAEADKRTGVMSEQVTAARSASIAREGRDTSALLRESKAVKKALGCMSADFGAWRTRQRRRSALLNTAPNCKRRSPGRQEAGQI